jgi:hypothetical protein
VDRIHLVGDPMIYVLLYTPLIIWCLGDLLSYGRKREGKLGMMLLSGSFLMFYGLPGAYTGFAWDNVQHVMAGLGERGFLVSATMAITCLLAYRTSVWGYKRGLAKSGSVVIRPVNKLAIGYSVAACVVLSSICLYIYAMQYGGFEAAYRYTAAIRSGHYAPLEGFSFTFTKYFIPCILFLTIYLAVSTREHFNMGKALMLFGALALTILFVLIMGGRGLVVFTLLAVLIALFFPQGEQRLKYAVLVPIGVLASIGYFIIRDGKQLFNSFRAIGERQFFDGVTEAFSQGSFVNEVMGYFATRIYSGEVAILKAVSQERLGWFHEVVIAPLYLVPERLSGVIGLVSVSQTNTALLTGSQGGTIPPGLVGYGVYSLWVFGPLLCGFVFGYVLGQLQSRYERAGIYAQVIILPTMIWWMFFTGAGDPRVLVRSMFPIFVFAGLYWFFNLVSGRSTVMWQGSGAR